MNYEEAGILFKAMWRTHCEARPDDRRDKPMYRELWGIWLDGLRRDNTITQEDYFRWLPPAMPRR